MDDARLEFDQKHAPPPEPAARPRARRATGARRGEGVEARRVPARCLIFDCADPSDRVYEVSDGAAMILRAPAGARRRIVDIVGARRLFGFSRGRAHECAAVALAPCVVTAYPFDDGAWDSPLGGRLALAMTDEIERLRDHVVLLGQKSAMARVAGFLGRRVVDPKALRSKAIAPLTRAEMADYLGLTIETVSRTFGRLKRLRVLGAEEGGGIVVADVRRLKALARGEEAEV